MRKVLAACCFLLFGAVAAQAGPFPVINQDVGVCDPNAPSHCIAPDASGNVPITGTITASLGGFTPSASGARMTALSVTTSDSSGNLPTGAVTVVSNVGTNPMYCNVNGVAATTSDELIPASSWFAFTIPATVTTLHCIATGGSTTANGVGGAGLATGSGGGSGGGGGGGAITIASGAVASGAYSSGSIASGAYSSGAFASGAYASGSIGSGAMVDLGAIADAASTAGSTGTLSAKLRLMTTQLGTINTTLGTPFQAGGSIGNTTFAATQSGTWNITNVSGTVSLPTGASTAANQATEISSLATIATNTGAAIPAGTALIGKVGIDQTTDGTTNGVRVTNAYPSGATPITASATGTTAATTATLAGTSGKTTYICGYSIRANATGAATVTNTITGVITATLSSIMWVAPLASGIGIDEQIFSPCIPASGTNQAIAIVSGAPGSGGTVSSKGWGYQQ